MDARADHLRAGKSNERSGNCARRDSESIIDAHASRCIARVTREERGRLSVAIDGRITPATNKHH